MADRKTVLVVDDEEPILDIVQMTLEDEGYEVATATNGAEALASVHITRPALILLDMRMPVMNGWEFAEAYRKTPPPHAPIVVITAGRDAAEKQVEIGAAGYIGKPFDIDELTATVAQFFSNGHATP